MSIKQDQATTSASEGAETVTVTVSVDSTASLLAWRVTFLSHLEVTLYWGHVGCYLVLQSFGNKLYRNQLWALGRGRLKLVPLVSWVNLVINGYSWWCLTRSCCNIDASYFVNVVCSGSCRQHEHCVFNQ